MPDYSFPIGVATGHIPDPSNGGSTAGQFYSSPVLSIVSQYGSNALAAVSNGSGITVSGFPSQVKNNYPNGTIPHGLPLNIHIDDSSIIFMGRQETGWSVIVEVDYVGGGYDIRFFDVFFLSGGNGSGTFPSVNPAPVINPITVPPGPFPPNTPITVPINTTNATSVSVSGSGSTADASSGSVTLSPGATTTYTVTATGPGGTATTMFTIFVTSNAGCTDPKAINWAPWATIDDGSCLYTAPVVPADPCPCHWQQSADPANAWNKAAEPFGIWIKKPC